MYLVVDNARNRTNCPDLIGSWHFRPPSYAGVKQFPMSSAVVVETNSVIVEAERRETAEVFGRIRWALKTMQLSAAESSFAVIRELDFATPFIANWQV